MNVKKIIIASVFFLISFNLYSQKQGQDLIDSLLVELPKAIDDTNKINLLAEISYGYIILSPETGIEFAKQGIELANKINFKYGLARNYNALMQNYWAVGNFDLAIEMYNAALKIEDELGLIKQPIASKLTNINRTFTYPTSDYTNLTSELRKYLTDVTQYMKDNPGIVISITGHSDAFGSFQQNDFRAKDRADKIVDFLVKSGITRRRLLANGKGALDPIATNDTEEGRRKNRRVVIRAIGQ